MALAINSGFVTFPKAYTLAYSSGGLAVWTPTPPEGYAALGCLATSTDPNSQPQPPSLTDMVVVHASSGVPAPLGQCLDLTAAAEGGDASMPALAGSKGGTVNAWCVDNAVATFTVCSAAEGAPVGTCPLSSYDQPAGHVDAGTCLLTLDWQWQQEWACLMHCCMCRQIWKQA